MSVEAPRDRRAERAAATRREILEAAWQIVRAEGLGALSMRDLGAIVGLRAQSIYAYFPSKNAIFDAMFAEGNRELYARMTALPPLDDEVAALRAHAKAYVEFCTADPARYQLLYQRTIPGFEPSAESFALATRNLELSRAALRRCGVSSSRALDAWTGMTAGLAAQQNANEPGGRRWLRLVDEFTDMFLNHYRPASAQEAS